MFSATDTGHGGVQGECEECKAEARTAARGGGDAVFGGSSGKSLVTEVFREIVKNAKLKQGRLPAVGEMLCLVAAQVRHWSQRCSGRMRRMQS